MERKKGSLLEYLVKSIFENIGFKATTNARIEGFEVDVYAEYKDTGIVTQCKQYERKEEGRDTLADLIIQWSGKRRYIDCDNVVIALWGFNISRSHDQLAKEEGVVLWDNYDIKKMLESSYKNPEETRIRILSRLGIKSDTVERYIHERAEKLDIYFERIFHDLLKAHKEVESHSGDKSNLQNDLQYAPIYLEGIDENLDDRTKNLITFEHIRYLITVELASCFRNGILFDEQKYGIMYSKFCKDMKYSFLRSFGVDSQVSDYRYDVREGFIYMVSDGFSESLTSGRRRTEKEVAESSLVLLDPKGDTWMERLDRIVESSQKKYGKD